MIPALASKDLPTGGSVRNLGQPTLFLGPAGSKSEMHMDMYLLPFWLSCYLGVKKFRVILFEDSVEHFEGDYMNVGRYKKTITVRRRGKRIAFFSKCFGLYPSYRCYTSKEEKE